MARRPALVLATLFALIVVLVATAPPADAAPVCSGRKPDGPGSQEV